MNANQLKERTKVFSIGILDLVEKFAQSIAANVIAYQIIKSGTSVAANYRAACRARSDKEFLAKMNIVLEESDETQYWLEIISAKRLLCDEDILPLLREANELTSIFVCSIRTVDNRARQSNSEI